MKAFGKITKRVFFILFILVLSVSCQLPDPGVRGYTFDYEFKPMKEIINDYSLKYRLIIFGTVDGVHYYAVDTLNLLSDDVFIKTYYKK